MFLMFLGIGARVCIHVTASSLCGVPHMLGPLLVCSCLCDKPHLLLGLQTHQNRYCKKKGTGDQEAKKEVEEEAEEEAKEDAAVEEAEVEEGEEEAKEEADQMTGSGDEEQVADGDLSRLADVVNAALALATAEELLIVDVVAARVVGGRWARVGDNGAADKVVLVPPRASVLAKDLYVHIQLLELWAHLPPDVA